MNISHNSLIILNIILWILPFIYWKGNLRIYVLIINSIFSISYWTYIAACDILNIEYGAAVIENRVDESLFFSAVAAVSFNVTMIIFSPRKIKSEISFIKFIIYIIYKIPGKIFLSFSKLFFLILILYCYFNAIKNINTGDRLYYLDLNEYWYNYILPILGLLSSLIIIWEYQKFGAVTSLNVSLIVYSFTFLTGFDGGRRPVLITIIALSITTMIAYYENKKQFRFALINLITLISLSGFLSFGRNLNVGWQIIPDIINSSIDWDNLLNYVVLTTFAPMPTVHVNTWMLDYIDTHGTQGYSNYARAILNTLFPNFIFNQYLFGEPLVRQIGSELGWFGFDFGFMAESIYSGGLLGTIIIHSLIGLFVSIIIKKSKSKSSFAIIMMGLLLFGMLNGLRSDFMNFLKSFLYPSVFVYLVLNISKLKIFNTRQ